MNYSSLTIEQRQQLRINNPIDAEWILCHPDDFSDEQVSDAEDYLDFYMSMEGHEWPS